MPGHWLVACSALPRGKEGERLKADMPLGPGGRKGGQAARPLPSGCRSLCCTPHPTPACRSSHGGGERSFFPQDQCWLSAALCVYKTRALFIYYIYVPPFSHIMHSPLGLECLSEFPNSPLISLPRKYNLLNLSATCVYYNNNTKVYIQGLVSAG